MTREILFYYESRQNPNGDPGFENQPRLMADETIMVTDVRIKRTMRDHARDVRNQTLFVDYDKDGKAITADGKAKEIVGSLDKDVLKGLLEQTFDVPLFGALVPIRKGSAQKGRSEKLTGPLQFGMARSVNKVNIINPTIVGRFVGDEKKGGKEGEEQFSTFGRFYSVEYALIKVHGALNKSNLGQYLDDEAIAKKFEEKASMIHDCLWNGTNGLITRSKYPQRSILYIDVDYKDKTYSDLPMLVSENPALRGNAKSLGSDPFDFSKLVSVLAKRRLEINSVGICGAEDIYDAVESLGSNLRNNNINVEMLVN